MSRSAAHHAAETADDAGLDSRPLLVEVAWEVCQQLGGIYTVIRSKAPTMIRRWGRRYCCLGPFSPTASPQEFEEATPMGPVGRAVQKLRERGFEAHYGRWLITGEPRAVLLNPESVVGRLGEIRQGFWDRHRLGLPAGNAMLDAVAAFGFLAEQFFRALAEDRDGPVIAHFHEWMGGAAIPDLRRAGLPLAIVFTTHATQLGRVLAMHDPAFYDHLPQVNWGAEARRFAIEPQVHLERAAAHGAHVFTTLSEITAFECEHLLGRRPDLLVPNGLNLERFVAMHEFQNLHLMYKEKIQQFVIGHFFPSYTFDLDRTLFFFSSGRYEYRNKGYDLVIESLARLNHRLRQLALQRTIVFFLITQRPYRSISPEVLRSRAVMEEMRRTCDSLKDEFGERLFLATALGQTPSYNRLVDDTWRLRLRRLQYAWRTTRLPPVCTHDLADPGADEVLNQLRACNLWNLAADPVKVVYHPDFIVPSNPLFGLDYDQFVRGCHLGIFPSFYEPWGYTPLECMARGVPAITSDLCGFGTYLAGNIPDHQERGIHLLHRRGVGFDVAANECTEWMLRMARLERRERIALRNQVERCAEPFDWSNLGRHYHEAHDLALARLGT